MQAHSCFINRSSHGLQTWAGIAALFVGKNSAEKAEAFRREAEEMGDEFVAKITAGQSDQLRPRHLREEGVPAN